MLSNKIYVFNILPRNLVYKVKIIQLLAILYVKLVLVFNPVTIKTHRILILKSKKFIDQKKKKLFFLYSLLSIFCWAMLTFFFEGFLSISISFLHFSMTLLILDIHFWYSTLLCLKKCQLSVNSRIKTKEENRNTWLLNNFSRIPYSNVICIWVSPLRFVYTTTFFLIFFM